MLLVKEQFRVPRETNVALKADASFSVDNRILLISRVRNRRFLSSEENRRIRHL